MLGGGPGTVSGLILRIAQCIFVAASAAVMYSAPDYSLTTAFRLLVVAMGIQTLWSLILICFIIALKLKSNLQRRQILLCVLALGDGVLSVLSLAGASSSGSVVIAYSTDFNFCIQGLQTACFMFKISVGLAFVAWFLLALSFFVSFYLAASI